MHISPDQIILWEYGNIQLNATLVFTWIVMLLMVVASWAVTRRLTASPGMSRGQNTLEVLVLGMQSQIQEVAQQSPARFLPFIGTLFLFIITCNVLSVVPGFEPPTGSLSTAVALSLCVFVAVPVYGIQSRGLLGYLKQYMEPSVFMLPFNVVGELSRTIALAFRLFGNIMSGTMIVGVLLAVTPLFFPVPLQALGLLTGVIQAYIFAILAMVYIASATGSRGAETETDPGIKGDG